MPHSRKYPCSVWRGISIRLRQGESVVSISAETGICQGTLYRWEHQALVDAGIKEGTLSPDAGDLVSACKRIRQLEEELAIVKAASALWVRYLPVVLRRLCDDVEPSRENLDYGSWT